MNNIFSSKFIKILACIMVVTQGMLLTFVATFYLGNGYINSVMNDRANSSFEIKLGSIPENKSSSVIADILKFANENKLFVSKLDYKVSEDGSFDGIELSVTENYKEHKFNFSFLGQEILTEDNLDKLFVKGKGYVIGVEDTSLKSVGGIPHFITSENLIVKKLSDKIEEGGSANGIYRISDLKSEKINDFLKMVEKSSGLSIEQFDDKKSVIKIDRGTKETLLLSIFFGHSILLASILILMAANSIKTLGILILQGWSRSRFLFKLFSPILSIAFFSVFLGPPYGTYLSEGSFHSITFYSTMILYGVLNLILTCIFVAIASTIIFFIKPINAIQNRLPKKRYLTVAFCVYLLFMIGISYMCVYVDGPYKDIQKNIKLKENLEKVSDYSIMIGLSTGDDQESVNMQSLNLDKDLYNWYKSFSDDEGVYYISSEYYSSELLKSYIENKIVTEAPDNPFWLFKMSPTYINKLGINIPVDAINQAKSGKRTYLIPKSITKDDATKFKNMMKQNAVKSIQKKDIKTIFNDKKEFNFVPYEYHNKIFTLQKDLKFETEITHPFIQLVTPESMTFVESESFRAMGFGSTSLYFTKKALKKYTTDEYLSKYQLKDNKIQFATIRQNIDGFNKKLTAVIQWFFIPIIALSMVIFVLLIVMFYTFQLTNKEIISIKKFLGYSTLNAYRLPIYSIVLVSIGSIISVIIYRSIIGVVYLISLFIVQMILMNGIIIRNQFRRLTQFLKG